MKIETIDIYWAKLPLAFVWKTSYADQHYTDTILVRMEGGGHYAWGESCPPYIPGYSADHTVATFHTLREHMAPQVIGQDIESADDEAKSVNIVRTSDLVMMINPEIRSESPSRPIACSQPPASEHGESTTDSKLKFETCSSTSA